jgi:hypothetical protein
MVNRAMARYYFGDTSPLGKHLVFDGEARRYEIIGVVGDAKYLDIREPFPRTIYLQMIVPGLAIGAFAGFELRRVAASVLEGLRANSPAPLLWAACGVNLIALAAAYVPARRAAHVEPLEALRQE